MCRFSFYKGSPQYIHDIICRPGNSLVHQSRNAGYHPGCEDPSGKRNIVVNGDGFGLAWYGKDTSKGSCIFKLMSPAWSERNLRNISMHTESAVILGHVRAASDGSSIDEVISVNYDNCHPFVYGRYTFVHNGGIPDFSRVRRQICNALPFSLFKNIRGNTDSEHIFFLFLSYLSDTCKQLDVSELIEAMNKTISAIELLCKVYNNDVKCSLNIIITDGVHTIATRYRSDGDPPPSLYFSVGHHYNGELGNFQSQPFYSPAYKHHEIIISSCPLNRTDKVNEDMEEDTKVHEGWCLLRKNSMLVCYGDESDLSVVKDIKILHVKDVSISLPLCAKDDDISLFTKIRSATEDLDYYSRCAGLPESKDIRSDPTAHGTTENHEDRKKCPHQALVIENLEDNINIEVSNEDPLDPIFGVWRITKDSHVNDFDDTIDFMSYY